MGRATICDMRKIILDIETKNTFDEVGGRSDPTKLDLSMICTYDSESDTYASYLEEDLPKLWPILERADMLIGYNSDHFDIPILNKYYAGDITGIRSLDLMKKVQEVLGFRVKLDDIASATLGKGKIGNGLEAILWWRAGEVEKVRKYCLEDVRITKEIYDYALQNSKLHYERRGKKTEVPIDTSDWERVRSESGALNKTLPW